METTAGPRKVTLATGALRRLGALVALTTAAMITAPVALGQPSPDPAPVAPEIAPDAAPTPAAPAPPVEPPPPAEPAPAAPAQPAPAPPAVEQETPAPADRSRAAPNDRPASTVQRAQRETPRADRAMPRPVASPAFLRLETLVPSESDEADPSSTPMLLAAGALLALVLASGSFVSVLARLMPPAAVLLVVLAAAAPAQAGTITPSCDTRLADATGAAAGTRPRRSASQWSFEPRRRRARLRLPAAAFTLETATCCTSCRVERGPGSSGTVHDRARVDRDRPHRAAGHDPSARSAAGPRRLVQPPRRSTSSRALTRFRASTSCTGTTYSGPEGAGASGRVGRARTWRGTRVRLPSRSTSTRHRRPTRRWRPCPATAGWR